MAKLVELDLNPSENTLRQFGGIAFVGFGAFAALAYFEKLVFSFDLGEARVPVALTFAALGVLAALFALVYPKANRVLYVGLSLIAFPIGFVLSYVIMGSLYFLIIGPIALLFRLFGRDSMNRRYDPNAQSYWSDAEPRKDSKSYFHQY